MDKSVSMQRIIIWPPIEIPDQNKLYATETFEIDHAPIHVPLPSTNLYVPVYSWIIKHTVQLGYFSPVLFLISYFINYFIFYEVGTKTYHTLFMHYYLYHKVYLFLCVSSDVI